MKRILFRYFLNNILNKFSILKKLLTHGNSIPSISAVYMNFFYNISLHCLIPYLTNFYLLLLYFTAFSYYFYIFNTYY